MQLNHFRRYSTKVDKTRLFLQKAREARDTIDEYLPYPSRAAAARMLFIHHEESDDYRCQLDRLGCTRKEIEDGTDSLGLRREDGFGWRNTCSKRFHDERIAQRRLRAKKRGRNREKNRSAGILTD